MKKLAILIFLFFCQASLSLATNYPVILENSTPEDVAKLWVPFMSKQLDNCFENYKKKINPNAKLITIEVVKKFTSNYPSHGEPVNDYCSEPYDLQEIITKIYKEKNRKQALPIELKEWMKAHALDELKKCSVNGIVDIDAKETEGKCNFTLFYSFIEEAQRINAIARAKNPKETSYKWLIEKWETVGNPNLDKDFYNPILVDPEIVDKNELFDCMRKHFDMKGVKYESNGYEAIYDFWKSSEGPEEDPTFLPIINVLKTSSFKKYFYFKGGASENFGWSSNVLVVVDEHNQMFGFQMGYSE